jgi:hypothetical protein
VSGSNASPVATKIFRQHLGRGALIQVNLFVSLSDQSWFWLRESRSLQDRVDRVVFACRGIHHKVVNMPLRPVDMEVLLDECRAFPISIVDHLFGVLA